VPSISAIIAGDASFPRPLRPGGRDDMFSKYHGFLTANTRSAVQTRHYAREREELPEGSSRKVDVMTTRADVLETLRTGGQDALDRIFPVVYEELRAIAPRHVAARKNGTLVTTELVHEAYLKLVDQSRAQWRDRAHFFALASAAMRHVLVDRARARLTRKRGGARRQITLDDEMLAVDNDAESLLAIDDALNRLAELDPRLARVVECRFYGGLSEEEIAEALGVTERTVQRLWSKARMVLSRSLAS
jgi:RNA polymerase sigma factor (TIGR02999 family)